MLNGSIFVLLNDFIPHTICTSYSNHIPHTFIFLLNMTRYHSMAAPVLKESDLNKDRKKVSGKKLYKKMIK